MKSKLTKRHIEHKYYARQFACFWLLMSASMAIIYKLFSVWYIQYLEIAVICCTVGMAMMWAYYAIKENMEKRRSKVTEQA
jgi:predicted membrane protein